MGKDFVFRTMEFPARQVRLILDALKAEAFQLGTKRQYYIHVVPDPGHERAVALICGRLFQRVPAEEAGRVLKTLPKTQLKQ